MLLKTLGQNVFSNKIENPTIHFNIFLNIFNVYQKCFNNIDKMLLSFLSINNITNSCDEKKIKQLQI